MSIFFRDLGAVQPAPSWRPAEERGLREAAVPSFASPVSVQNFNMDVKCLTSQWFGVEH
jgi:hypothetical protein